MISVDGYVAPGFGRVRDAFVSNFEHHGDVGAAVCVVPTRYASGFMLPTGEAPLGGPSSFGHPGRGGSLGFADPESGVAFGYVVSHIRQDLNDTRAAALVAAVNASLR